jgi:hypothetical protein
MSIINQDLPVWHEFGLANPTTLMIRCHSSALEHINRLNAADGFIRKSANDLGLSKFTARTNGLPWGFGKVLIPRGEHLNWVEWVCPLPKTKGKSKRLLDIAATLQQVFTCLFLPVKTGEELTQLMQISYWLIKPGHYGHSLGAHFSPKLQSWAVQGRLEHHKEALRQTLLTTFRQLGGHAPKRDECDFKIVTRGPRQFEIVCGWDGCNMNTEEADHGNDEFVVVSNNVSTVAQQLALFSVLAHIHDLARSEGC